MEENGSSARAGRRDTSSSASVSRAFLSVSPQTTTLFCSEPRGRTTGKVRCPTGLQRAASQKRGCEKLHRADTSYGKIFTDVALQFYSAW